MAQTKVGSDGYMPVCRCIGCFVDINFCVTGMVACLQNPGQAL